MFWMNRTSCENKHIWEDHINIKYRPYRYMIHKWRISQLAQNKNQRKTLMNTVTNIQVPHNFLTRLAVISFL
jgi:hypothetical protein